MGKITKLSFSALPQNYRGIQLTSQLSKARERLLGEQFLHDLKKKRTTEPVRLRQGSLARDAV
eukprot:10440473-Alexandrium_andersonii.AAC.1